MSIEPLSPRGASGADHVLWALVNGARQAHAHVRPLSNALELRVVVDGRIASSQVFPARLAHQVADAATARRDQLMGDGWSAVAYGFVRQHANGVQARVSRDVFGGEWTASISVGHASVAPAGYWAERTLAQVAADYTAHPGCRGGAACGAWGPAAD